MLGLVALTMAIIWVMPKLTKVIPAPLVGIGVVAGLVIFTGLDVPRVGDLASIKGGLPAFHLPMVPLKLATLEIILPYAVILAAIGLIESLLTLTLIDELTDTRGRGNKECIAQGTANVATGFFGGMGGCAMIGQSMINVNSGGRGRLSGITAALALPGVLGGVIISPDALNRDVPLMLGLAALMLVFARGRRARINRFEGALFVAIYIAYLLYLGYTASS